MARVTVTMKRAQLQHFVNILYDMEPTERASHVALTYGINRG